MIISLRELIQILVAVGNSPSQEENILTTVKNSSTSPKVKEESEEDLEASTTEEVENFGEQSCEPESNEANMENIKCDLHEEGNLGYSDLIETWFKTIMRSHKSFILPYII